MYTYLVANQTNLLIAFLIFVVTLLASRVVKSFIWSALVKLLRHQSKIDNQIINDLHGPANAACFVVSILASALFAAREDRDIYPPLLLISKLSFIALGFWIFERTFTFLVRINRLPVTLEESSKVLILTIFRALLGSLAILVLLDTSGISITPILASLGVGSLAVALALQDTLGNFFSGLYLLADKPIRPGDLILTEDGTEASVIKIGWRSTQMKTKNNCTLVLPNSKLANSRIINFDLHDNAVLVKVQCGVAYDSNLARVEAVALEVAQEVQRRAGEDFTPLLHFHTFADSSINFEITLRAKNQGQELHLKHDLIKSLHDRFAKEQIEIPYPQRVIHQA